MTNTESSRSDTAVDRGSYAAPRRTHWTGLVGFAAFLMILLGVFQAIEGLAAHLQQRLLRVRPNGLVVHVDYTVWGWTHLLLGVADLPRRHRRAERQRAGAAPSGWCSR